MIPVWIAPRSRTRLTRIRRPALGLVLLLGTGAAVVPTAVDFLDLVGRPAPDPASVRVDGIVVFSGGSPRVLASLRLLRAGRAPRLLVAGGDDVEAFRAVNGDLFACCVDLHPTSRNTAEDAAAISRWARARRIGSVLAVTNDVHMPRAMLELRNADPALRVIAYSVRSRDGESGFERPGAIVREYAKWIAVRIISAVRYGAAERVEQMPAGRLPADGVAPWSRSRPHARPP